jgi:G3E family GTPase
MILWEDNFKIMRIKGLLRIENDDYVYCIQGVNDTFEIL